MTYNSPAKYGSEDASDWEKLEQRAALVRSLGFEHEQLIDREQLYRLVPALAPHCVGALYTEGDGFARPYHALTAFRLKAQSLGVRYQTGTRVTEIDRPGDYWRLVTTDGVIDAKTMLAAQISEPAAEG